ncbi:MAG: ABC-F family ATP-binding cassette domain-containing protein [Rhodothermaceae bacterium]|nr:ABC-F family ATP-binding cassette domain-containing protein [Rhodothermaceae bacterium]MXZ58377.1 ABC-F family ATP-binding cassette domain-containing protein [Rhodothermaceae bacterium]MYB90370.1 ABC-F family ATP-binding cassette domain-containing protein [Rhodothermaceae bacterium]MYD67156.1 ABC-F family ATP-binding cassette domain-containing protein [Rhodothermaceae bacterium]MYG44660.1 ABC-F family ATP-binding cassette domain-containing protein [Rhodothermaceae bacterium]
MIQLQNIAITLGGNPILEGLTWTVGDGKRIGLIGPNGAGKTTLLRVIGGYLETDGGEIAHSSSVGYLAQDVQEMSSGRSVIEETLTAFEAIEALQEREEELTRALETPGADQEKILLELDLIHERLAVQGAHSAQARAEAVLEGLGFVSDDLDHPIDTLSGGYRMRVALARILLQNPDVLLLDEPTNHLDILSIDWLEKYLKNYAGTVILVSHDRYFLNRMIDTVAHLYRGRVTEYAGNYDYFLVEREKRRVLEQAAYENQQREIQQAQRFIERFRYKASKARQVQSRIKHLDKLEHLPPPESPDAQIRIRFPSPNPSGRTVLSLTTFSKVYTSADTPAVRVFNQAGPLQISRGQKIALIGKNGAGKSTLARILFGSEAIEGERKEGHNVNVRLFAQHQADALTETDTVLESLNREAVGREEVYLRTLLGAFLFTGDDVFKPVSALSGGEKSRLALARTLVNPANFLILDEPTNHLDIQSIKVLIEALRQYDGTFVVVSHDRHFLDHVANVIWHVGNQKVRTYEGTYSEYQWALDHGSLKQVSRVRQTPSKSTAKTRSRSGGPKTKDEKRREAEARNRAYREAKINGHSKPDKLTPHQRKQLCDQAEAAIAEAEARKLVAEKALADPDTYSDPVRSQEATSAYATIKKELDELYANWETLMESLQ